LAFVVVPRYRAEAWRYEARREIDRLALGKGNRDIVLPASITRLEAAARLDPRNGQIWGDLAYATTLVWHVTRSNPVPIGKRAEAFANKALALGPDLPAFSLWHGVALDMQGRQTEGALSFRRALALAPNRPECHYYYAYHLSVFPERVMEAIAVLDTCLSLDPGNSGALALRQRLLTNR
jgi:tetratricopeptide (TPR) repeat protein